MNKSEIFKMMKSRAYEKIYNFLSSFGLNTDAYKHLENISFVFRPGLYEFASYDTYSNKVTINKEMFDNIHKAYNEGKLTMDVFDEFVKTVVHEILHSNRTMLLNNTLSYDTYAEMAANEKNSKEIHNYDKYLSEIIDIFGSDMFDNIIPIKVTTKKNNICDIIAYNKERNQYYEYKDINCNDIINNDYEVFLGLLSTKLKGVKKYRLVNDIKDVEFISTPDSFLLNRDVIDLNYLDAINEIDKQETVEEAFTELFSALIVRDANRENINEVLDDISRDDDVHEDVKLACRMVEIGGENIITWFMSSAYDEVYTDKFKELLGSNYDEFLNLFNKIAKLGYDDIEPNFKDLMHMDTILDEVESRRR